MVTGGPLFTLRLWGLFCPCLQKDEDRSARQSLLQLNQLGTRVDWHTSPKRSNVGTAATGFVQSLFGLSNAAAGSSQSHTDVKPPTPAHLRLVDATKDSINWGEPYPELQLVPLPQQQGQPSSVMDATSPGGGLGGLMKQNSMSYQLDIPLHHVMKIESIEPTMLVIFTKDVHNTSDNAPAEKETARISFQSSDDRDAVLLDLKVLVEWNKHRLPDGIEEELPAAGIRQRAQKAAHFAKREIEMLEKKRDREKRKSQHMQGGAGLKYTAMAMANQASSSGR